MYAAMFGHVSSVQILLRAGADPTIRKADGKTAFDIALEKQQNQCAELLRAAITAAKLPPSEVTSPADHPSTPPEETVSPVSCSSEDGK